MLAGAAAAAAILIAELSFSDAAGQAVASSNRLPLDEASGFYGLADDFGYTAFALTRRALSL